MARFRYIYTCISFVGQHLMLSLLFDMNILTILVSMNLQLKTKSHSRFIQIEGRCFTFSCYMELEIIVLAWITAQRIK